MTLVIDANVALAACTVDDGFGRYDEPLIAPPLLWSEARASLHVGVWRGLLSGEFAQESLEILERAPIRSRSHRHLGREAWRIADRVGWAKTYDAEYIALAVLTDSTLLTLDRGMQSAARLIGIELHPV